MHRIIALFESCSWPYEYSRSNLEIQILSAGRPLFSGKFSRLVIPYLAFVLFFIPLFHSIFLNLLLFSLICPFYCNYRGVSKRFSSMFLVFSLCPWLFSFSISFSTAGCRWIEVCLPVCCISFAPLSIRYPLPHYLPCDFCEEFMELTFQCCYICIRSAVDLVRLVYIIDWLVWTFRFQRWPQFSHPVTFK